SNRAIFVSGKFLAIFAFLAIGGSLGGAQVSGGPAGKDPKKNYTNKSVFHLPGKKEPRFCDNLQEVVLYVKCGAAGWVRQDAIPPTSPYFTYSVPQDGEYWFTVVMIDRAGKATPPDVTQAAPNLKVVVDTQAPKVDVRPWTSAEGEKFIKCMIV